MSLFPLVTPFIVVAAVLGFIWGIGSILLTARSAGGEGDQAALIPVIIALVIAAVITIGVEPVRESRNTPRPTPTNNPATAAAAAQRGAMRRACPARCRCIRRAGKLKTRAG